MPLSLGLYAQLTLLAFRLEDVAGIQSCNKLSEKSAASLQKTHFDRKPADIT
jgi:hypothetical protein